jgi:hypothetical protein
MCVYIYVDKYMLRWLRDGGMEKSLSRGTGFVFYIEDIVGTSVVNM